MRPTGTTILLCACALAATCALALWLVQRASARRDRAAWLTFGVQLLLTAWVLVPAAFGPFWFTGAVVAIALESDRELMRSVGPLALRAAALGAVCCGALALLMLQAFDVRHLYFMYGVVELNDSFAFIVGRSFGKRQLAAGLSPGKTVEGLVAGWLAAAATGAALAFLEPQWSRASCAAVGLLLALAGSAADLCASALKRRVGIKDFSDALPGHGGVLDAYDSMLLVAPLWCALLLASR